MIYATIKSPVNVAVFTSWGFDTQCSNIQKKVQFRESSCGLCFWAQEKGLVPKTKANLTKKCHILVFIQSYLIK